ncbi:MAG: cytochrome c3 family protein [Pseudomonadota bacterium]
MSRQPALFAVRLTGAAVLACAGVMAVAQDYVGSETCVDCHADEAALWSGSHHALAWTSPEAANIVADFDSTDFTHDGMTARFRIDPDGSHHVAVTEKDGVTTDYPLHSVVGIAPLQQYLLETEPGRLQSFDVVWDVEEGRWYHLYPDQDLPPDDGLHWSGPYKNWNARCAECHATGFEKRYDPGTRSYASVQAEIGVGCEACHGPGSAHLSWTETGAFEDPEDALDAYGFSMSFETTEATIQQCATCHARRGAHGDGNPLPGTPFHDAYNLALLRPGLYHADGQILDEVYVYGSFLQSKMYAQGVSCLNCHEAHSGNLLAEGNAVCTQCHSPAGNPDFPSMSLAVYDAPAHHHHEAGSAGAACRSCHMIERTYMGIDGRRDHSFRVPRPDLAAETAAPDACTDCHTDQTADWAAAEIEAWFPDSIHRGRHYGQILARARVNPVAAGRDLAVLAADPDEPGMVRATALWLMEQSGDAGLAARAEPLLVDPDPLVRAAAVRLQRLAPDQDRVTRVVGLLGDPIRSVRMAAAELMLNAPIAYLPPAMEADRNAAQAEWQAALRNRLDYPETHLQLGGMALMLRDPDAAGAAFAEVVELDPQQVDAWIMLARIAAATRGADAVREVLDGGLAANPEAPALLAMQAELEALSP